MPHPGSAGQGDRRRIVAAPLPPEAGSPALSICLGENPRAEAAEPLWRAWRSRTFALLLGAAFVVAGIATSLVALRASARRCCSCSCAWACSPARTGPAASCSTTTGSPYVVGSLALAVILFDGGLRTRTASFRGVLVPALALVDDRRRGSPPRRRGSSQAFVLGLGLIRGAAGRRHRRLDGRRRGLFFLIALEGRAACAGASPTPIEIESATNDPVAVFPHHRAGGAGARAAHHGRARGRPDPGPAGAGGGRRSASPAGWRWLRAQPRFLTLPQGLHPLLVVASAGADLRAGQRAAGLGLPRGLPRRG